MIEEIQPALNEREGARYTMPRLRRTPASVYTTNWRTVPIFITIPLRYCLALVVNFIYFGSFPIVGFAYFDYMLKVKRIVKRCQLFDFSFIWKKNPFQKKPFNYRPANDTYTENFTDSLLCYVWWKEKSKNNFLITI